MVKIKILGSGPTGALLALSLASTKTKVTIYDSNSEDIICSRSRAYAITHSSRKFLQKIELWQKLTPLLIPFNKLRLEDTEIKKKIFFSTNDLLSSNRISNSVGWIIDHQNLMNLLISEIRLSNNITALFNSESNYELQDNEFIFAADGPSSLARKKWGINVWSLPYGQGCITAKVLMRGSDSETANEIFRSEGPLAILPMGLEVFQVVWSGPLEECTKRVNLQIGNFLDKLASNLPIGMTPDCLLDKPIVFPVKLYLARSLYRGRGILVGESAHSFHPVGGQGLNICWRDINALTDLFNQVNEGNLNIKKLPSLYHKKRYKDLILVAIMTHSLVILFSSRSFFNKFVRRLIMFSLFRLRILRAFSLKLMTDGPMTFFDFLP